ncbi:MAG: alpha/beta fold hydrolase, partial [Pseudomonadota bacterium]
MDKASEHFVHVDGRKVFYRRYGSGPAVVFLHGSPQSSRAVKPLIDAVGGGFTCIAVDTPGNGLSDPLPLVEPNAPDYADAFAKFLDALGLGRVALYGFHTGAGTAMEFLRRHPGRATCLVADGYAVWTDEERDYLLRDYLPPFDLKPDGAHLANLWSRMEEQTVFFPWFERTARGRMVYDVPSPQHIHANAMDVLNAGDNFRPPYASAFRRRGAEGLHEIQDAAVLIAAAANDPLAPHLDRLPTDLPPNFTIEKTDGDRAAALARFYEHLKAHPGDPPPAPPKAGANSDGVTHEVVKREAGGLHWSGSLGASGRPLVLLHQAGGSKRLFEPTLSKIATTRPVLAFDLPGHGDSTSIDPPSSVSDYTDAIALALSDLGVRDADICGHHLGGQIAAELGARGLAQSVGLIGAP